MKKIYLVATIIDNLLEHLELHTNKVNAKSDFKDEVQKHFEIEKKHLNKVVNEQIAMNGNKSVNLLDLQY